MQAGLLDSQLQTLEKPAADENDVITLQIDQTVATLLANSMVKLDAYLDNLRSHPEP
jgi:gluconate kinase